MGRDRDADLATLHAVHAAATASDFARAAALARPALEAGLEHPLLYNVIALRLEQEARLMDAAQLLRTGTERFPADTGLRNALGLCLLRLERPAEALAEFETLVAATPDLGYLHTNRGAALFATGALARAEQSYRRALELDPNQPLAMTGIATIALRRGLHSLGQVWAEQALVAAPGFPDAIVSLAEARLGQGAPAEAQTHLQRLLAEPRIAGVERAHAQGLLGDALDALERRDEAFQAYAACNAGLREGYRDRFGRGAGATDYVASMRAYFDTAAAAAWRQPPAARAARSPVQNHVFVLGFLRSGTTLLELVLEGHPGATAVGEQELLVDGVREFLREPEGLGRLLRAPPAVLDEYRGAYWARAAEVGAAPAGPVFIDKHPLNTLKLPLIARLFPDARVVLMVRDPRDVVLSCFRRRFDMTAVSYELLTLEGGARLYGAVMDLAGRLEESLPLAIRRVRYETLVADFDVEMRRLCEFLGLEWTAAMRDFAARTRERKSTTPSIAQLARGLDASGVGSWRRYAAQMAPVLPLLEPWLNRLGYAP